jgi:hypothetical protein
VQKNGTFKFKRIDFTPTNSPVAMARIQELVRDQHGGVLVLTRNFQLLMQRAHVLPKSDQNSIKTKRGHIKGEIDGKILPRQSCARIWPDNKSIDVTALLYITC